MAIVCYMANPMNTNEPFDLRLPTPGCYLDPEKAGMDSDAVFQGMTAHLFYTLGKLATSASALAAKNISRNLITPIKVSATSKSCALNSASKEYI